MDRIFNGLIYDFCIEPPGIRGGDLKKREQRLTSGYACILVYSIGPGSSTLARLREFFKVRSIFVRLPP